MTKIKFFTIAILLLFACSSIEAQTKKSTKRPRAKTAKVEKPKVEEEEKKDTIAVAPKPEEPKYKSLSDSLVVKYLRGGYTKDNKLHLATNANYDSLTDTQKQEVLSKVAQEFADYDLTIYSGERQRELWVNTENGIKMVERWNNDSLQIEHYLPLELQRQGKTKLFYYVGGLVNGSKGSTDFSLNLRAGTYLYEDLVDASVTLNLGGSKASGSKGQFIGDVGIDARSYIPCHIKGLNLAPYAGLGMSWSFAPSSYFEMRFLAGGCWLIGPGSFDLGFQYGIKSGFSMTFGYTFRIPVKKKKK